MASKEARDQIKKFYKEFFNRTPGEASLNYWANLLDQGSSVNQVQGYILSTPEGAKAAEGQVKGAFSQMMGREPDADGLKYWMGELQKGMGLESVMSSIANSKEAQAYKASGKAAPTPVAKPEPTLTDRGVQQGPGTLGPDQAPRDNGIQDVNEIFGVDYAALRAQLRKYGLESVYDDVAEMIVGEDSQAEVELKFRELPAFRERFKVIFDRESKGLPPISPDEVLNYEAQLSTMTSYYGLPVAPGDSVQAMTERLLGGDVSLNELSERLTAQRVFARAVLDDPNQDREAVEQLMGQGFTLYDVANMAIDPNKTLDEVQRRFESATVANEAAKTGFRLHNSEAEELARLGVDQQAAKQGFGQLAVSGQIVNGLNDEVDPVTREMELAAVAGDVQAINKIERSRANRLAANDEGGGFASTDEGFAGLR